MSFVAAAIGGGALIGGAASIIGAGKQSDAMTNAAQIQAGAANHAADIQQQMFNQQQANERPWMSAGTQALGQMQTMAGKPVSFTQQDFQNNMDPAYQWDLQQGQQALERSAAARGGLRSGGTLKDLTSYAQGAASNEYQNAYNRFMNNQNTTFNRLATIAGYGQNANAASNAAAQNYGSTVGNLVTGAGNAQAASTIGQGQVWGNTISGIGSQLGGALTMGAIMHGMPSTNPPVPSPAPMSSPGSPGGWNLGVDTGQLSQAPTLASLLAGI